MRMQVRENEDSYFPHSESSSKNPQLWKKADIPLFPPANVTMSHGFGHFDSLSPVCSWQSICAEGHLEATRTVSTSVLLETFPDQAVQDTHPTQQLNSTPLAPAHEDTMKMGILGTHHSSSKFRVWLPVILFGHRPVETHVLKCTHLSQCFWM